MAETIKIGGELESMATGKIVAAASAIKDKSRNKTQEAINGDVEAAIENLSSRIETPPSYNDLTDKPIVKTENNGFIIVAHGNRANKATAQNAFAEGGKTEAAGIASHAEGSTTLAEGDSSHAEGAGTEASGTGSHAEGYSTSARGAYSHVEGNYTETVASSAHAEGENTVAYGKASHAEGNCMWSDIAVSRAYTAGSTYLYVKQEVPLGYVITNYTQTVGVQKCVLQEQDEDYRLTLDTPFTENFAVDKILSMAPSAFGDYSHREGNHTIAMGNASHAEGNSSKAFGDYSHAEGQYTKTTNIAEHASGKFNKSTPSVTQFSVGIGADEEHRTNVYEVTTGGKMYVKGVGGYDGTNVSDSSVDDLATAISQAGGVTQKEGERGYVLDNSNSATGLCSFAEGNGTKASGENSHAEGSATKAIETSSHAEGNGTKASGKSSHAEGNGTTASGKSSHAEGVQTEATGESSHAEGNRTTASGESSHAEGNRTSASGYYSHAEGDRTGATRYCSHAEGYQTSAGADYSHAEGENTRATGTRSHAEGNCTETTNDAEHAEGSYNLSTSNVTKSSIGIGTAEDARKNAVEVTIDGSVYIKGIGNYDGTNITASGVESVQEVIARLEQALGRNNS